MDEEAREEREKEIKEFIPIFNEWKAKVDKIVKDNNITKVRCYNPFNDGFCNEDVEDIWNLTTIYSSVFFDNKKLLDVLNEDDGIWYVVDIYNILKNELMIKSQYFIENNTMYFWYDSNTKWENL